MLKGDLLMKRIICLSIIFFFLISSLYAQEEGLNQKQIKEYNRLKLSIDILTGGFGSISEYGSFSYADWKKWQGYQGFYRVTEADFFQIAGYFQEAWEAKKHHETTEWLVGSGSVAIIVGTIMMIIPLFQDEYTEQSTTTLWVGFGIMAVGTIPFTIGIFRGNWTTVSQAQSVADEYNNNLVMELKKRF